MLKTLLQSHNLVKRSIRMRRQQHLCCTAEQLNSVLRCGSLFRVLVLQNGVCVTDESETVKSVVSDTCWRFWA